MTQMKVIVGVLFIFFILSCSNGQNQKNYKTIDDSSQSPRHITIVNWNIEWFGSDTKGPYDKDLQQSNTERILQYLHADLFGLCEIVDVKRLQNIVEQLGNQYDYIVCDYAAGTNNPQAIKAAQKMAFVFNKNIFQKVHTRTFMKNSRKAAHNFSNGRYPFLLQATIKVKGKSLPFSAILIHAKSGADMDSYERRLKASNELADSIKSQFNNQLLILMGDFNDVLRNSISGNKINSPYAALLNDGNIALTMQLAPANGGSSLHYKNIIDHQIVNQNLYDYYIKGSVSIRKDIVNAVRDFKNGKTTDHYPISSTFDFTRNYSVEKEEKPIIDSAQSIQEDKSNTVENNIHILIPTFRDAIEIKVDHTIQNIQFLVYNSYHQKVLSVHHRFINPEKSFFLRCKELPQGNYTLVVMENGNKQVFSVSKN